MDANASIIIHALKLRLHWSAGLGLLQRGDRARDWREFSVLKASGETGAAAVTWRQYKKRKLFFQTQSLICSLSPRFLSMHCCYRFREGEKKTHHACRSKVRWVLNTAELRGALGKEIAAGVFSNETELHQWAPFEHRNASGVFSSLRWGGEGNTKSGLDV